MHRTTGRPRSGRWFLRTPYSIRARAGFQRAAWIALLAIACDAPAPGHPAPRPLLVIANARSPVSVAIGRYYLRQRGLPEGRLLELDIPLADPTLAGARDEVISRAAFVRDVLEPLAAHLRRVDPDGAIQILVTTRGIPLRIVASGDEQGVPYERRRGASVDAELALLRTPRRSDVEAGRIPNPYFGSDLSFPEWRRAHPGAPPHYLVARLTGYALPLDPETGVPRDVRALIDAARARGGAGPWVIDEDPLQPPSRRPANAFLLGAAAATLRALGLPLIHDRGAGMIRGVGGIAGYASWGSNDAQAAPSPHYGYVGDARLPGSFGPRAIAVDLVSTNARSFATPPRYGQSLVADLIRLGVAGAAGHVSEPTLAAVARPQLLFHAYARGAPAVEAWARSLPYLGWTNLYVGDPLMTIERPVAAVADRDGDGVDDADDDCRDVPDPAQRDSDGDGFGNLCDADFDDDGRVRRLPEGDPRSDLQRLEMSRRSGLYVPEHDLDGDGEVDERDVRIAELFVDHPPGPSGRVPAPDR